MKQLLFDGGPLEDRTGVALDEPQVQVLVQNEIKAEHLKDVAFLEEGVLCHHNRMNERFFEGRTQVIIQPIGIIDFPLEEQRIKWIEINYCF